MNEATETRHRLIDVARRLFAERGFDATSVRDITGEAKANLGAITYHFGSKQALYDAVLEQAFAPVAARARVALPEGIAPLDAVEQVVRGVFEEMASRPDLPQLILQQAVQQNVLPEAARRSLGLLIERLASLIRRGQRDGTVRPGDPLRMAISVMAQPAYFNLVRRFAPDLLAPAGEAAAVSEVADHLVDFVRAGLGGRKAKAGGRARGRSRRRI